GHNVHMCTLLAQILLAQILLAQMVTGHNVHMCILLAQIMLAQMVTLVHNRNKGHSNVSALWNNAGHNVHLNMLAAIDL
ncbi:hypothetical protein ABBQ38_009717, partial [Trebouxia sp. C0009 RCD-2024]